MAKNTAPALRSESSAGSHNPLRAAFLARSVEAIKDLANRLDPNELGKAVASSNNIDVLITGLAQPNAVEVSDEELLLRAHLRGLRAMDEILKAEGGMLNAQHVAALLRMSRQAVDKRRLAGKLLAMEVGRRGLLYPAWQFRDGKLLPGMEEILALLSEHSPFSKVCFFLWGTPWLSGERPLDRLRGRGDLDPLRRAARTYGEHSCP
jgi:hypothetical protein